MPLPLRLLAVLFALLLLTACADPRAFSLSTVEQHYLTPIEGVEIGGDPEAATIRQSFMPARDGFHRVAFLLAYEAGQGREARAAISDDSGRIIYETRLPLANLPLRQPLLLLFEPQPDSALRVYTLEVSLPSEVYITSDGVDRYQGRLQVDGQYQEGDLLLEWGYKPTLAILGYDLLNLLGKWGAPLALNALLWTLPGLALLSWLRHGDADPWSVPMLIVSAWVAGGALLVLLPMVAWWFEVPLGSWAAWATFAASAAALLLARRRGPLFGAIEPLSGPAWLYIALLALVLLSRLLVIHPLNAPLWGDSVHHSLITQLLLDNGGVFATYEPYLPLAPFTYHAGFHLLAAWQGWSVLPGQLPLSGIDATLLSGQWQNVMAVAAVGLLAEGLTRRAGHGAQAVGAGLIAVMVAGLLSDMPAFYVNWGRYTQLAGQIFLPPAILWSYASWRSGARVRWLALTVMVVVALALTHYRVLILYAAALPLILLAVLWDSGWRLPAVRRVAARALASGAATVALILPWYWKLQESVILQRTQAMLAAPARQSVVTTEADVLGALTQYVPPWFLAAAAIALILLLARRCMAGWLVGGWMLLMFLVANPQWFRLPGTGLVDNFMLQIALYIPLAVLVGCAVAMVSARAPTRHRRAWGSAGATLLLAVALWGGWRQVGLAEPRWHSFLTAADWRAARWVQANTPAGVRFHVNGFFAYYDTTVAGSDGGEWLPLIAGRDTTVPPMIYAHEAGIDPNYRASINDRYRRLQAAESDPARLAALMRAEKIDYIYIGGQQGRVGAPADDHPMDPLALAASDAFETVYSDDFVWIFRVR